MSNRKKLRDDCWTSRVTIDERGGFAMLHVRSGHRWDGGDLIRIREAASVVFSSGLRKIAIDLGSVTLLPSGFMQMLCTWQERGREVFLLDAKPNVREMLWFKRFAERSSALEDAGREIWRIHCRADETPSSIPNYGEFRRDHGRQGPDRSRLSPNSPFL